MYGDKCPLVTFVMQTQVISGEESCLQSGSLILCKGEEDICTNGNFFTNGNLFCKGNLYSAFRQDV